jgi:fructose-1-phosphate kinase PfkB-like protein
MTPPIYTLTGNLLAERTLEYTDWAVGRTQRAVRESFNARGKGVNVSNMLRRLGTASTALIFAGGPAGAECETWLRARGVTHRAFPTLKPSRTGTIIWSEQQAETTFLGPDVPPDAAAVQACADYLSTRPDGGVLVLCGSFPGWAAPAFACLRTVIQNWAQRGELWADVYGPPLQWVCAQPATLVKINRQEFDGLFPPDRHGLTVPQRLQELRREASVQQWIVSNGPDSLWLLDRDAPPREFIPPRIREISPTGSGDVLLAAILHAVCKLRLPLDKAVAFALPYAAANAAHPGVADFDLPPALASGG